MDVRVVGKVPKVDGKSITYVEFWESYMAKNKPVLLTGVTEGWNSVKEWKLDDGTPNTAFMKEKFGSANVQASEWLSMVSSNPLLLSSYLFFSFLRWRFVIRKILQTRRGGK